jgi:arylsulfatase A-like enzyme
LLWLGTSLLPLLIGQTEQLHEYIFAETNYHAAYEPQRCVRTQRYKYIQRFDPRPPPILVNCDDSQSKDILLEHSWKDKTTAEVFLYDLIFDPNEQKNIAGKKEVQTILREMQDTLKHWMIETNDPLLTGPVPLPQGARVNSQDAVSPDEPLTNRP